MNIPTHLWHLKIEPSLGVPGFKLGELYVYWKIREGDWIVGIKRVGLESEITPFEWLDQEAPEDTSWRRLGAVKDVPSLHLRPAFPNRAVVVRPEFAFTLLPGERIHIFLGVPVTITLQSESGLLLFEEPVHPLSNTWFGTPTDGELCYAMRTLAKREGEMLDFGPARIICPVRIRNQSKEKLTFERLCLRVQYLNIYESDGKGLWSNEASVMVKPQEAWSRVAYASKAHAQLKNPRLLVPGTEAARGTYLIRALTEGKGFFQ